MLFRLDYSVPVENVTSAQQRFATLDEKRDGLTVIGRWHEAGNRGFMVCEADDVVALALPVLAVVARDRADHNLHRQLRPNHQLLFEKIWNLEDEKNFAEKTLKREQPFLALSREDQQ